MHELSMIQDIFPLIEKVAKENHLKSISKIVLHLGKLCQVQSDFLQFAFAAVADNTIASRAELVIEIIPITVFCTACQKQFTVQENVYVCPECGGVALEFLTGKEIILASVDGEA